MDLRKFASNHYQDKGRNTGIYSSLGEFYSAVVELKNVLASEVFLHDEITTLGFRGVSAYLSGLQKNRKIDRRERDLIRVLIAEKGNKK